MNERLLKLTERIEQFVVHALMWALLLVVVYSTIVFLGLLVWGIASNVQNSFGESNILHHLHSIFGGFLMVLIGLELVHTVKVYIRKDVVHVEVVLLVALIGVSRHVIDLDFDHLEPLKLLAVGGIILALSAGYFFVRRATWSAREATTESDG